MTLSLFGCKITVSPLFMGMITLMLLIDTTGMMSLLLGAMVLHEAGHLLFMAWFRCMPKEIQFLPFEINMIAGEVPVSRLQQGLVLVGGIAVNAICFLCDLGTFSQINLFLAVFNGLPIYSMDGWQLLALLLAPVPKGVWLMKGITILTAMGLLLFGGWMIIKEHNPMLVLFLLYIGMLGIREKRREPTVEI